MCTLLPSDAILVGQSLNCDLNAMKLMHPYVIDTSVIFNLTGNRNQKSKLQLLAKKFLGEEIQIDDVKGHSSIEDSTACLKLTKLKLSKDIYFGDLALENTREILEEKITSVTGIATDSSETISAETVHVKTPIFSHALKNQKKTAIITTCNNDVNLSKFNSQNKFDIMRESSPDSSKSEINGIVHHKELTARKVISKTSEVVMQNDFNISHFNVFDDLIEEGDEDNNDDEKITHLVPKLDKWIEKVWSNVALNGLFVVIFGGRGSNTNGLSMFNIKS